MGLFGRKNKYEEESSQQEDEQEEEENTNTYEASIECPNCGDESYEDIPKGTTIKEYAKDMICVVCGCKIVEGVSK